MISYEFVSGIPRAASCINLIVPPVRLQRSLLILCLKVRILTTHLSHCPRDEDLLLLSAGNLLTKVSTREARCECEREMRMYLRLRQLRIRI